MKIDMACLVSLDRLRGQASCPKAGEIKGWRAHHKISKYWWWRRLPKAQLTQGITECGLFTGHLPVSTNAQGPGIACHQRAVVASVVCDKLSFTEPT